MKLTTKDIEQLDLIVKTAKTFNIPGIIIEDNIVRGVDMDKTSVIFSDQLEWDVEDLIIGITRLDVFSSRLDIIKNHPSPSIEGKVDLRNGNVMQLIMKAGKSKIDYRCGIISTIVAPKQINDVGIYTFTITEEELTDIIKSYSAMKNEYIHIFCDNGVMRFELTDDTNDKCVISSDIELTDGDNFVFKYPMRVFLSFLKNSDNLQMSVGSRGMVRTPVNTLDMYMLPHV
jgi:hypothetical protein